eukprot:9490139-Pyramimonas_sp.AAC.1
MPHARMPADPLTKVDPCKGNLALHDLLCRGTLSLIDEHGHLSERVLNESLKSRSRGASRRALELAAESERTSEQLRDEPSKVRALKVKEEAEEDEDEEAGKVYESGRGDGGGGGGAAACVHPQTRPRQTWEVKG